MGRITNYLHRLFDYTIVGQTWSFIWEKLKKLYLIQFIYILTLCLVLEPFFSWILGKLLKYKGYSYITSEMMVDFFLNPFVLFFVIITMLIIVVLLAGLQAYVYQYTKDVYLYGSTRVFSTLFRMLTWIGQLWKERSFSIVALLIGNVLFQNIVILLLAGRFLTSIRYILTAMFSIFYFRCIVGIIAVIFLIFFFHNIFTVSCLVVEKCSIKDAKEQSKKLFRKQPIVALKEWIIWSVVNGLFMIIFYFFAIGILIAIILLFVSKELQIAVFSTVQDHVYALTILVSVLFGMTSQVTGNLRTFYLCKYEQGREVLKLHLENEGEAAEGKISITIQKRLFAVVLIVLLCMDIVTTYDRIRNGGNVTYAHLGDIQITSHRGASAYAPENTLPAIEKALHTGTDYVEIDVQETKDGEVVLMHDRSMERTTGVNKEVNQLTLEEIKRLDAGYWYGKEYEGTQIPRLQEVLELCKGKCMLNIEIKSNKKTPELEGKVVDLIEQYDFVRQCVVTSVYKDCLKKVKEYDDEIMTGYILSSAYGRYYLDKEIDFLSMRSSLVTERVVRLSHKYGKEIYVWTVNSKKDAIWLSRLGVDNIITDRPSYIRNEIYGEDGDDTWLSLLRLILQ